MAKRKVKRRTSSKRRGVRRRQKKSSKFNVTLQRLRKLKASQRRQAMTIANNKFIRDFTSAVKKLRRTNALRPALRKKLKRHSKLLRKLTNKRTSLKVQRKVLSQRGGFLPLLLAALPAIGSIAGGIISRV